MKALCIIDMQGDFIDGALGTPEAQSIVGRVVQKLDGARAAGQAVIFTRDTHGADYLNTQEGRNLPVPHCIQNTEGWQITPALDTAGCKIIDKPGFGSLELAEYIAEMPDVDAVELVGLCTDICVISNALLIKARLPELPVAVDAACCAGVTPASHANALKAMAMCQIEIING